MLDAASWDMELSYPRRILCAALLCTLPALGCEPKASESQPVRLAASEAGSRPAPRDESPAQPAPATGESDENAYAEEHRALLDELEREGITSEDVLEAMRDVPRHEFVPEARRSLAYANRPLPIGNDQTISQPYIVALMTQLAEVDENDKVLEIGTGSGYQAAVLSKLAGDVYTIEIIESLGKRARRTLERLDLAENVHFRIGDGYAGWPEAAPFDAIVVTAAPPQIPQPLKEQLAVGGKLVIPVGESFQELRVIERTQAGFREQKSIPVRFVPMTGKAQQH